MVGGAVFVPQFGRRLCIHAGRPPFPRSSGVNQGVRQCDHVCALCVQSGQALAGKWGTLQAEFFDGAAGWAATLHPCRSPTFPRGLLCVNRVCVG